jgi:uncharacterized protein YhfF
LIIRPARHGGASGRASTSIRLDWRTVDKLKAGAVPAGKDMDAELRRVLNTAYPGQEARYFLPMSIGSAPEHAGEGAALILRGVKTLTSSPFCDYPDGRIPFVRALSVLLDGAHRPRGIVETTRVEIMPFQAITEEMAQAYGEGERTASW